MHGPRAPILQESGSRLHWHWAPKQILRAQSLCARQECVLCCSRQRYPGPWYPPDHVRAYWRRGCHRVRAGLCTSLALCAGLRRGWASASQFGPTAICTPWPPGSGHDYRTPERVGRRPSGQERMALTSHDIICLSFSLGRRTYRRCGEPRPSQSGARSVPRTLPGLGDSLSFSSRCQATRAAREFP